MPAMLRPRRYHTAHRRFARRPRARSHTRPWRPHRRSVARRTVLSCRIIARCGLRCASFSFASHGNDCAPASERRAAFQPRIVPVFITRCRDADAVNITVPLVTRLLRSLHVLFECAVCRRLRRGVRLLGPACWVLFFACRVQQGAVQLRDFYCQIRLPFATQLMRCGCPGLFITVACSIWRCSLSSTASNFARVSVSGYVVIASAIGVDARHSAVRDNRWC
jgi:hypothetical protein